jgi:hypothetical protein
MRLSRVDSASLAPYTWCPMRRNHPAITTPPFVIRKLTFGMLINKIVNHCFLQGRNAKKRRRHPKDRHMATENDIVLIHFEDQPLSFARIEQIRPR